MLELGSYPLARPDRQPAPRLPEYSNAHHARGRVWSWLLTTVASRRVTISGPLCHGPAMLRSCSFFGTTHESTGGMNVAIGYHTSPVTEAGVLNTVARPYTTLTELLNPENLVSQQNAKGFVEGFIPGTLTHWAEPLDFIVTEPTFFPVISISTIAFITAELYTGQLRLTEAAPRAALGRYPLRRLVPGAELTDDPGARFIADLTDTGRGLPMFDAAPPMGPPSSWYWQRNRAPFEVKAGASGHRGPEGYHYITAGDARFYARQLKNGHVPYPVSSPPDAPQPVAGLSVGQFEAEVDNGLQHPRPARPTHEWDSVPPRRSPRLPRIPRPPREPRESRESRDARRPRIPRTVRRPRVPRPPRPPRKVRPPRRELVRRQDQPKKTVPVYDYYCGHNGQTGACAHFGPPHRVAKGTLPPPPQPGTYQVQVSGVYECCANHQCDGPDAAVLGAIFDLLPAGWRAKNDPREERVTTERARQLRQKLGPLPTAAVRRIVVSAPFKYQGCCVCGAVGACYANGVDCRLLPVLQHSHGEC